MNKWISRDTPGEENIKSILRQGTMCFRSTQVAGESKIGCAKSEYSDTRNYRGKVGIAGQIM